MSEEIAQEEQQTVASWDDAPEYGVADEETPAPDSVQSDGEEVAPAEPEPVQDENLEAEPDVNWEKRYKDLEGSHSRRGNEVHSLKQERDDFRYQKLEMQQKISELEALKSRAESEKPKQEPKPDPFEDERYWDDDDKEILKEYPEIVKVTEKLAKREAHRAKVAIESSGDKYEQKIADLESQLTKQNEYISQQRTYSKLDELVGSVWRKIDNDQRFHEYVNKSKLRYKAMVNGDLEEKAEVFESFLQQLPKESEESSPAQPQDENRRKAAKGLVRGQVSKASKPKGELSRDELWRSIPDPE